MFQADTVLTEADKQELLAKLRDPLWRLRNLYCISDKKGKMIRFAPNAPQERILHAYFVQGIRRFAILKSRQIGFSTLICLILFDQAYWGKGISASIVDMTQGDASEKLRSKCRFAWEHLPAFLRENVVRANDSMLEFASGSLIHAGKNARGGTLQFLLVSEWGKIAHEDPKRSEEIKTGALPAADEGVIFVESTFRGGKGGHFYELLKNAQETPAEQKTAKDFHFFFVAWYEDPTCTLEGDARFIEPETTRYLDEKERELMLTFTPGQRMFYAVKKREQGIFMLREYPTTVAEAFQAPVEGSIYGDILSKMRAKGQVKDFLHDTGVPVFAVMDIGWSDKTAAWLFQVVGREVHWLRYVAASKVTAAEFWRMLAALEIPLAGCLLPWDSSATAASVGVSYKDAFIAAGAPHVSVLPATREIWAGINAARDILQRSYVHRAGCAAGIEALEAYHTKETSSGGLVTKDPVHDWSSHGSDAFRYGCEAIVAGLVKTKAARRMGEVIPLPKAGDVYDLQYIRQQREKAGRKQAISGIKL